MALPHSLDPLAYPPRFQFGQTGSPCRGKAACTDTCLQMLIEYWKEKTVSLSTIRRISKNPDTCTGNNAIEVKRVIEYFNLPYIYVSDIDTLYIAKKVAIAPVFLGVGYAKYPNKSTVCGPIKAEVGGRSDCNFRGAHAVLALKYQNHLSSTGTLLHHDFIMRDPDHASAARPWKPNYDRITLNQLDRTMKALVTDTAWTHTFAFVPTRRKSL